jgi:cation diffusion facilitator CzcD-associated flavoprotein CzcO
MEGSETLDVLVVGAGISGISMAAHMTMLCPGRSFLVTERRANPGGTWDLFRYPGVRSDSDMHTLGFRFAPWADDRSIAGGEAIRDYLARVIAEFGLGPHIRCATRVVAADWRAAEACWHVVLDDGTGRREITVRWLHLATGYYDYDEPHEAVIPGLDSFAGEVVHPQFWPADLDYAGKRVVVVGSGATAVTLVPAMAETAAHVTMLQRTPTWMVAHPSRDPWARRIRRWLGEKHGNRLIRFINVRVHSLFFNRARREPGKVAEFLRRGLREHLGEHYDPAQYEPPYGPWQQRLCLVPDADLFEAVRTGKAAVVTGTIAGFDAGAVRLADGEKLPADIVVTATGLKLELGGKIAVSLDGAPVDWNQHWFYRSCLFSNLPNLSVVFGYLNNSWTLRADNTSDYVCRVLEHMAESGADTVTPELPEGHGLAEADIILFSSGYLQRARPLMPRSAATLPWRLNMNYLEDCRDFRQNPVSDGVLRFAHTVAPAREFA